MKNYAFALKIINYYNIFDAWLFRGQCWTTTTTTMNASLDGRMNEWMNRFEWIQLGFLFFTRKKGDKESANKFIIKQSNSFILRFRPAKFYECFLVYRSNFILKFERATTNWLCKLMTTNWIDRCMWTMVCHQQMIDEKDKGKSASLGER